MAYTFDAISAIDPDNPERVASNASITIFAPGDPSMTLIAITDTSGVPLENPITVNDLGFGPAFMADIDRVAWSSGDLGGFFSSYEGIKNEAVAARNEADAAALDAAAARAAAELAASNAGGGGLPPAGSTGQLLAKASGADRDVAWVDAPTGGSGSGVQRVDYAVGSSAARPTSDTSIMVIWIADSPPVHAAIGDVWLNAPS